MREGWDMEYNTSACVGIFAIPVVVYSALVFGRRNTTGQSGSQLIGLRYSTFEHRADGLFGMYSAFVPENVNEIIYIEVQLLTMKI